MRRILFALTVAAAVLGGTALEARSRLTPEERLGKMLEGREAGRPVSCISNWDTRDMEVLDGTAIVYRAGSTIYVNRPANAQDLDSDDIMLTRLTGSQFCRLDIVQTLDRNGHFINGFINLGDFVPYRRVARAGS